MTIIKIAPEWNGSHNSIENADNILPGWAVIPDNMETPNFPFGTATAAEVDGVMTVTSWVAGTIPAPEPVTPEPTAPTLDERVTTLETAFTALKEATT